MMPTPTSTPVQPSSADLVLLLRDELWQLWKAGSRARVEDLLTKWPQVTIPEEGLLDLIYQEVVAREEAGEEPTLEEYRARFPHLDAPLQRQFALHSMLKSGALSGSDDQSAPTVTAATDLVAASTQAALTAGARIHHYCLEGELGRGGMGIVFKARDERLQRAVALKLLLGQEFASPDQLHRFRAEAAILAQLQHPNIVQVFEIGDHDGAPFFAMEFVTGKTLQHKVREHPLDPGEAARLVDLLARAMHTVHQRGIIHRDLKPSNVLLSDEQVPKITDFGLARHGQSEVTADGAIMGTPSYMAPEQALGQIERIGPPADVYALGAILFELLTGRAPFRGASIPATLQQVVHLDPPSPRSLQPGIPRDLETICLKALQKDPAKRFASAQELADDLQRFLHGEPIRARPVGRIESLGKWARREKRVAALSALALLATVVGFVGIFYMYLAERRARVDTEEQLYFNHIFKADTHLFKGKISWAEDVLAGCPESLRDWEWYHLQHRCKQGIDEKIEMPAGVISLAAHPNLSSVAVGRRTGMIAVVDDGRIARPPFLGHLGNVNWIGFSPDGNEFFSGGEDSRIHGWKLANGEKIKTFSDHLGPISCFAFHPQKPWIASTAFDGPDAGEVFIWDRETGERIHTLRKHQRVVTGLAFHPEGKLLASASHDKTITLWDCQTGAVVRVLEHQHPISCVAFSPDGSCLASSATPSVGFRPKDDENIIWNTATGAPLHRMRGHEGRPFTLAFTPGGKRRATAGFDGQAKLWDVKTGLEVLTMVDDGVDPDNPLRSVPIMTLGFDRNGSLITGHLIGRLRYWRIAR